MSHDDAEPDPATRNAGEWITRFADALGVEAPDEVTVDELLAIAGVAAHSSERVAAPIACYLIGRAGIDPRAARRIADRVGSGSATAPEET